MLEPALLSALMEEIRDEALCHTVNARLHEISQAVEVDIDAI